MEEHRLENPSNARIFINYNNKKKVRFEYPSKKTNWKISRETYNSIFFKLSPLVVISLILVILNINKTISLIGFYIMSLYGILFISSPLVSFILSKSKWFIKNIPNINKKLLSEYYYKKVEKLDKPEFEIEYFDNIFLDYKARGEFGKYLERIEITEYPFKIIKKRLFRKKLKEQQDFIWRAKFYFKQIPKTGYLEVTYY